MSVAARHITTIDDVLAEVRELRALVERLVLQPVPREWLSVEEAARLAGRSPQAIRARCRRRGIDVKINNIWHIDRSAIFADVT